MSAPLSWDDYLSEWPTTLPAGKSLVHNPVTPQAPLGTNGSRAWLTDRPEDWTPCGCGWMPELGEHYTAPSR